MWGDIIEVWKDIEGYEGLYQVSNLGRIKSLERVVTQYLAKGTKKQYVINERIMKLGLDSQNNYLIVHLHKNKKAKTYLVHRLVAQAFIPNLENKPTVNHINEIKTDNRVENLEWMTYRENNHHGTCKQRGAEKRYIPVVQYDLNWNIIATYSSIKDASNKSNTPSTTICRTCKRKPKNPRKYHWRYVNDRT